MQAEYKKSNLLVVLKSKNYVQQKWLASSGFKQSGYNYTTPMPHAARRYQRLKQSLTVVFTWFGLPGHWSDVWLCVLIK